MSEPITYAYGISFQCPDCGFVIQPTDFAISFLDANLNGISLKEAYRDLALPQEIREREFDCAVQGKAVPLPEIDKVFLVG